MLSSPEQAFSSPGADPNRLRYARVAVLLPLDYRLAAAREGPQTLVEAGDEAQTFTYGIPHEQRGLIQPGQVVWVPFGRGRQQGVVVALSAVADTPAGVEIKPIEEPVSVRPLLTPAQIELARWMSRHYLAPLSECLRLFLPPGFGAHSRIVVEYVKGAPIHPDDLTPAQQALLLRLRRGPIPLSDLRRQDRRLAGADVLGVVVAKGLARLRDVTTAQAPRPQTERRVRLRIPPDAIAEALMSLGRASKQAEALLWLRGQPAATEGELSAAVGATPAVIRQLVEKGLVARDASGRLRLTLPTDQVFSVVVSLRGVETYRRVLEMLAHAGPEVVSVGQIYAETGADAATLQKLAAAGLIGFEEAEVWRDPLAGRTFAPDTPPILTADQQAAWEAIAAGLEACLATDGPMPDPPVYLLHGVTGSGKTELYLRALARVLAAGRQAFVLVPEISLTPQTIRRFAARFPGRVGVWHSQLSEGERFDTWRRAQAGELDILIGSRSALFAPLPRPGLIVLDEEHDAAYKQERTPRYHARETAIALARLVGAVVLLGSATPSLESMFQARRGVYRLLALPRRVLGFTGAETTGTPMAELPPVQIVDMREELRAGNRSMFSRRLATALQEVLDRGEQAILFLNRRGAAGFVLCRDCGHVMHCPRCAVPLTQHGTRLVCHHCQHDEPMPTSCPRCGSWRFKEFGAGTERLLEALRAEFPAARPLRWDRDTTAGKSRHEEILQDFLDHKADVLVGTQMIAKGLDLPLVTLVGVISADIGLFLPDFRAAERTFQVLTQVAGRAGRSARGGQVIVQTYHPCHYAVLAAARHDYETFYRQEMRFRQEHGYPPYRRLTRLLYLDTNPDRCREETRRVAVLLEARARELGMADFGLIGPAPAFFARERNQWRWHLLIRSENPAALLADLRLTPNWRVDVDPVEVL
ncbi:MAG: primosomal protein N' [Anaerolineae bacterium]|nr:primosomal protein N' [Anaerolineae bacterium]